MSQTRKEILEAIDQYWEEHHYGPTLDEIGEAVGLSKSNVLFHLRKLRDEGSLLYDDNTTRSFRTSKTDYLIKRSFHPEFIQAD